MLGQKCHRPPPSDAAWTYFCASKPPESRNKAAQKLYFCQLCSPKCKKKTKEHKESQESAEKRKKNSKKCKTMLFFTLPTYENPGFYLGFGSFFAKPPFS